MPILKMVLYIGFFLGNFNLFPETPTDKLFTSLTNKSSIHFMGKIRVLWGIYNSKSSLIFITLYLKAHVKMN